MGTTWRVHYVPRPGQDDLAVQVEQELDRAVALFSHWDGASELSRFNAAPAGPVAVSVPFLDLLDACLNVAARTDGAVDPTLGGLVDLWGFGPPGPRPDGRPPSDAEIADVLAVSGWRRTALDRDKRALLQPGGLRLDLSGLAKGWAVDRVSDRLAALGATHHLVEIGGELVGRGVKPDGQPWWVEIEPPPGAETPRTLAALFDLAVATSADSERRLVSDNRVHGHTLDGRTGRPADPSVAAVTVFADTAFEADAWATALTVLGPEAGRARAADEGLAALFTLRDGDDYREIATPRLREMLEV